MQGIAGSLDRSATRTTIAGKDILLLFVALLALNVASNYMLVGRFGMYEDDIIYLMKYLDFSVDWGRPIRKLLWDGSGRPFHAILMLIESSALSATQSAVIVYLVDAVVQTIAAILWFSVLAARVGKFTASLAAVFCLIMPAYRGAVSVRFNSIFYGCDFYPDRRFYESQSSKYHVCAFLRRGRHYPTDI